MNVLFPLSACLSLSLARSPSTHQPPSRHSSHPHGYQLRRTETDRRGCTAGSSTILSSYTRSVCCSGRSSRIVHHCRTRDAAARPLSFALGPDRGDVTAFVCVEWRQRRQVRPPEPQRSVEAAGSAALRRLPSVSDKMGAPRRAVA